MRKPFCEQVIEKRPDIIGKTVWFCPNSNQRLECVVNGNGTVSPKCATSQQFATAKDLASTIYNQSIFVDGNFRLPQKIKLSSYAFSKHLYFFPDASYVVSKFFTNSSPLPVVPSDGSTLSSCPGFQMDKKVARKLNSSSLKIASSGEVRSIYCTMDKRPNLICCEYCRRAKHIAKFRLKKKGQLCPGFDLSPYQDTIKKREWDDKRRRFAKLTTDGNIGRSPSCSAVRNRNRLTCTPCKRQRKVVQILRVIDRRRPITRQKRLTFSGAHILTTPEKKEKTKMLKESRKRLAGILKTQERRTKRAKLELSKFRPDDPEIRHAVQSIKKAFEAHREKLVMPVCKWKINDVVCGENKDEEMTLDQLNEHVLVAHLRPAKEANLLLEPIRRKYQCCWFKCRRQAPYLTYRVLVRHVLNVHVGNAKQLEQYKASLNAAVNSAREPSGRRYNAASRNVFFANYHSQSTWKKARALMMYPLPSVTTMIKIKNEGGVQSGIDYVLISKYCRATETKPDLRYGILVCDEVKVRPCVKFNNKTYQMFGLADDRRGEPATEMLVFQYKTIFSDRSFAINVAWFGTVALNADLLKKWFWKVVFALECQGLSVLATVCDGSGTNRCFQDILIGSQRKVFSIENKAHPGRRLWVLSDPSHLLKKLRNNWMAANRRLYNEGPIKWNYIEDAQTWQQAQKAKGLLIDRELTPAHTIMTSFGQMNVQRAVDVFSHPIENILRDQNPEATKATREFMRIGRSLWLTMNSPETFTTFEETKLLQYELGEVQQYFDEWKSRVEDSLGRTNGGRLNSEKFITWQLYDDLTLVCKGVPKFVKYLFDLVASDIKIRFVPRFITQDRLERDFSAVRSSAGGGAHPPLDAAAYALKRLNMNRLAALTNAI